MTARVYTLVAHDSSSATFISSLYMLCLHPLLHKIHSFVIQMIDWRYSLTTKPTTSFLRSRCEWMVRDKIRAATANLATRQTDNSMLNLD